MLKPRFKFVEGNKERRRELSNSSRDDEEMDENKTATISVVDEVERIMDVLS